MASSRSLRFFVAALALTLAGLLFSVLMHPSRPESTTIAIGNLAPADSDPQQTGPETTSLQTDPFVDPPSPSPRSVLTLLTGRCVDRNGSALAKVVIQIIWRDPSTLGGYHGEEFAKSSTEGTFLSPPLQDSVASRPFRLAFEWRNEDESELLLTSQKLQGVALAQTTELGDIVLGGPRSAGIRGYVGSLDPRSPLKACQATIYPRGPGWPLQAKTNTRGEFLVRGLEVPETQPMSYMAMIEQESLALAVRAALGERFTPLAVSPSEFEFVGAPGYDLPAEFLVSVGPEPERIRTIQVPSTEFVGFEYRVLGSGGEVLVLGAKVHSVPEFVTDALAKDLEPFEPLTLELESPISKAVPYRVVRLPLRRDGKSLRAGPEVREQALVSLAGTVEFQDGQRLANGILILNIRVREGLDRVNYREFATDEGGRFAFEIPGGDYQLAIVRNLDEASGWAWRGNPTRTVSLRTTDRNITWKIR